MHAVNKLVAQVELVKRHADLRYARARQTVEGAFINDTGDDSPSCGGDTERPKTRCKMVLLSCAVCGIELCYSAETAFVSPTLLKLGIPVAYMTLVWCLSPLLGIALGTLGSVSDQCTSRLGRRRPFILLLSIGIIAGLLLVPHGRDLGILLGDDNHVSTSVLKTCSTGTTTSPSRSSLVGKPGKTSGRIRHRVYVSPRTTTVGFLSTGFQNGKRLTNLSSRKPSEYIIDTGNRSGQNAVTSPTENRSGPNAVATGNVSDWNLWSKTRSSHNSVKTDLPNTTSRKKFTFVKSHSRFNASRSSENLRLGLIKSTTVSRDVIVGRHRRGDLTSSITSHYILPGRHPRLYTTSFATSNDITPMRHAQRDMTSSAASRERRGTSTTSSPNIIHPLSHLSNSSKGSPSVHMRFKPTTTTIMTSRAHHPRHCGDVISKISPPPFGILFTVLGVALLDSCCDACQSPCRAYLLDVSPPAQHVTGLATFTVMAGLGGSVGFLLGGVNWESLPIGEAIGGHVKVVFLFVLIAYLIFVSLTVTSVKEVPLDRISEQWKMSAESNKHDGKKYRRFSNDLSTDVSKIAVDALLLSKHSDYGTQQLPDPDVPLHKPQNDSVAGSKKLECGRRLSASSTLLHPESENHSMTRTVSAGNVKSTKLDKTSEINSNARNQKSTAPTLIRSSDSTATNKMTSNGSGTLELSESIRLKDISLSVYLKSLLHLPRSLILLCVTNLFCWMSLTSYSLYFTDFVGQSVYGGDPQAPAWTDAHKLYDSGVRIGSLGMAVYSASCSAYSLNIERLVDRFGARRVYVGSQLVYTVGAAMMALSRHPVTVVLLSSTTGIMYATLFTMPYLLIARYHARNQFEDANSADTAEGPKTSRTFLNSTSNQIRGLGTDIALVSSMVFLAQFILSAFMGSIIHAVGSPVAVMVSASVLSACGALTATRLTFVGL